MRPTNRWVWDTWARTTARHASLCSLNEHSLSQCSASEPLCLSACACKRLLHECSCNACGRRRAPHDSIKLAHPPPLSAFSSLSLSLSLSPSPPLFLPPFSTILSPFSAPLCYPIYSRDWSEYVNVIWSDYPDPPILALLANKQGKKKKKKNSFWRTLKILGKEGKMHKKKQGKTQNEKIKQGKQKTRIGGSG